MIQMKKTLATAVLGATALASIALATDGTLGASAAFQPIISFSTVTAAAFGTVAHASADGELRIATNGAITYSGTGGTIDAPATGTPASFEINGTTGATVEVSCNDATSAISDGSNTIDINSAGVNIGSGNTGAWGNGNIADCAGLGTSPDTYVITGTPATDLVTMQMGLDLSSGVPANATYNTGNASGVTVGVRVVYQ